MPENRPQSRAGPRRPGSGIYKLHCETARGYSTRAASRSFKRNMATALQLTLWEHRLSEGGGVRSKRIRVCGLQFGPTAI